MTRPNAPVPRHLRGDFDELLARLSGTATVAPTTSPVAALAEDLRFALALRGRVEPRSVLPDLDSRDRSAVLDRLAADCDTGRAGDRRWLLHEAVRSRVLRSKSPQAVATTLRELPTSASDEVTEALRYLYVEPPTDLGALAAPTLRTLVAASAWVGEHAPFLPDIREVRRLLRRVSREDEYRRFLSGGVYGRTSETATLSGFLSAPLEENDRREPRFLHLFGPGGIGKSTLVADGALAALTGDRECALVHLDFDRTDLDPTRSSTLDLELLRQAGLGSADMDRYFDGRRERIQEQFSDELLSGEGAMRQGYALEAATTVSKSALVEALSPLRQTKRPLLIILDTLEQVEAGGQAYIDALRAWLFTLAALGGAPELRVLSSGRTNPRESTFPEAKDEELLSIGELGEPGVLELLQSQDVPERIARQVFQTFGGNPLVLRLAADLITRLGPDAMTEIAEEAERGQLPPEMVQGLLYDRFLKHIDPPADRYAHPGLVLPQITVPLIQGVLGPVLDQRDMSDSLAQDVFAALSRATWLVRLSGTSISQRRDLRQLMLKLMSSDPKRAALVGNVRQKAIEYHSRFPTPEHRAFVVYHRLMDVRSVGELAAFENIDFGELNTWLRPHLDDLPETARKYAQGRLKRLLGADEALKVLSDREWAEYLAGDGTAPGEGDRLVRAADPMIALSIWRKRPVRARGELPLFLLQAFAETGEWADPALEGALDALETLDTSEESTDRLYWLTRLELLRLHSVSNLHKQALARISGGARAEHVAVTAVAEALGGAPIVSDKLLDDRMWSSETRLYLVHSTRFGYVEWCRPQLDALVVLQRDWATRMKQAYPTGSFLTRVWSRAEDAREAFRSKRATGLLAWFEAYTDLRRNLRDALERPPTIDDAQKKLDALDAAPLDKVTATLKDLRQFVGVRLARTPESARVVALRGTTPEFHRPLRQALSEALATERQIRLFMAQLRRAFSICPADLEPDAFVPRAVRDPAVWFLSLAQFADRARVTETLLDAALAVTPEHAKLRRVHEAWVAWDRAIGNGQTSDWILSQRPRD